MRCVMECLAASPPPPTWTKNHCVPNHQVVRTWSSTDAARWVCGEALEVADQTALGGCGLEGVGERGSAGRCGFISSACCLPSLLSS